MPAVWFALKKSLQCKSELDEVYDPRNDKRSLSSLMSKKKSRAEIVHDDAKVGRSIRSGCSRSIANLKDVISGSKRHMQNPAISPRSIGSSELLNPITHEVIVSESTCELKITNYSSREGNGDRNVPAFVGMIKPGTPGPRGHQRIGSPGRRGLGSPLRRTPHNISRRRSSSFNAISFRARCSSGADSHGFSVMNCKECGDQFAKWEAYELHHLSHHGVSELVEGDSSRKIVEIICRTNTTTSDNYSGGIERILKVHSMQKTLAQFEEYREIVKIKASKLAKKHPRCLADGNELLRFYGSSVECSLGINGSSRLCTSDRCNVCRILRHGFSSKREISSGVGVFTASTSGRALESVDMKGKSNCFRKALVVCRVIAGRVHRPLENLKELNGHSGFDSLAGKVGVYSNIEELYLLNPKALLPCFVRILATFSGKLAIFIKKLDEDFSSLRLIFHDFPGGADVFELIVEYCYNGGKIYITPSNFLLLHCAASFMEMNDKSPGRVGLVTETKEYLKKINSFTWNELLDCLKQCQKLLPASNDSELLQTILECVVDRASFLCLPSRPSLSSSDSSCADFSGDISIDSMRSNASQVSWWFRDLEFLTIELLRRVVLVMISRKLDHALISSFVFHYQRHKFLEASQDERGKIIEIVINLLDLLDGSCISVKRLLHLLQVSSGLKQKARFINKLESMIGSLLDEASVDDLLVPSQSKSYAYDVHVVLRFLKLFVRVNDHHFQIHRLKKVATLMDLYMLEVAPDPGLKPSRFLSLVTSLPDFARDSHDKVYEAIDIYLKVRTNLRPEETITLCRAVDCDKLSAGCMLHLAQNINFPAYTGDNALVSQQARLVRSLERLVCAGKKGGGNEEPQNGKLESSRVNRYRRVEGSILKVLKKLHTRTSKMHVSEPRICSLTKGRCKSAIFC